jgi:hypothetical protein
MWNIDYTYIKDWLDALDNQSVALIFASLECLAQEGPSLGRPLVDTLNNSTIANLKELRPPSSGASEIRIIFAFDPTRSAILLLGADKSKGKNNKSKWSNWYKKAIPEAERIFSMHVDKLKEGDGDV